MHTRNIDVYFAVPLNMEQIKQNRVEAVDLSADVILLKISYSLSWSRSACRSAVFNESFEFCYSFLLFSLDNCQSVTTTVHGQNWHKSTIWFTPHTSGAKIALTQTLWVEQFGNIDAHMIMTLI